MPLKLNADRLYGDTVKSHKVAAFTLSERVYPPLFKTPTHAHQSPLFCFVVDGGYTETYGKKTRICKPSTMLFHAPDETHAEYFNNTGGRSFIVEMDSRWWKQIREQSKVIDTSVDFEGGMLSFLSASLYKEFQDMSASSSMIIEGLMLTIIGEISKRATKTDVRKSPKWLDHTKELLNARFVEALSLADIAHHVGVHPVHLAQAFHKHFNCTIGEYVRGLRIELARRQLETTDIPLCQIALTAGFADQSHFTRTFKRYTGVPPSQYRDMISRS